MMMKGVKLFFVWWVRLCEVSQVPMMTTSILLQNSPYLLQDMKTHDSHVLILNANQTKLKSFIPM